MRAASWGCSCTTPPLRARSVGEAVGPAFFERLLPGLARMQALDPGIEMLERRALAVDLGDLGDEAHLHVGAGEHFSKQELAVLQVAVEIAQVVGGLAFDARVQRRARFAE